MNFDITKSVQISIKMDNKGKFSIRITPDLPLPYKKILYDRLKQGIVEDASMVVDYGKGATTQCIEAEISNFINYCIATKQLLFNPFLKEFMIAR